MPKSSSKPERPHLSVPIPKQESPIPATTPSVSFSPKVVGEVLPESKPKFSFSIPESRDSAPSVNDPDQAPVNASLAHGSESTDNTSVPPKDPSKKPVSLFSFAPGPFLFSSPPAESKAAAGFSFERSASSLATSPGSLSSASSLSTKSSPTKPLPTPPGNQKSSLPNPTLPFPIVPVAPVVSTIKASPANSASDTSSSPILSTPLNLGLPKPATERVALLAKSNLSPSETETTYFRRALATSESRHAQLDEEIAKKQEELKRDIEERLRLKENLTEYRAIINPVKRLPDDILRHIFDMFCENDIFQACSTWDATTRISRSLITTAGPWVLARVCQRWKGLAEMSPDLWSTVCVDNSMPLGAQYLLAAQLQRSAQYPLNVVCRIEPKAFSFVHNDSMLPLLLSTSFRWKGLVLRAPAPILRDLMAPVRGAVSNLARVALQLFPEKPIPPAFAQTSTEPSIPSANFLEHAPKLISLEVAGLYDGRNILVVPWQQLKELTMLTCSARSPGHLDVISSASSLEELQLEELKPDQTSVSARAASNLPQKHLKHLHLYNNAYGTVDQVLDKVSSSSLTHIYIQQPAIWKYPSLTYFLRKSSCLLTHLFLRLPEAVQEAETLSLLERLPFLEDLTVASFSDTPALQQLISGLTCVGLSKPHHVPKLASLTIQKPNSWTPNELVNMIASRCLVDGKGKGIEEPIVLEIVKVGDAFESDDPELLKKLQQCKDTGLIFIDSYPSL